MLQTPDGRRRAGTLQRAIKAAAVRPTEHTATTYIRVRGLTRRQITSFKKKRGADAATNPNDPFYWRFVEFGTSKVPARPFLRGAFLATGMDAVNATIADLRPRVQDEIEKLGRQNILLLKI